MKLYEIDQAIMECLDFETGEIADFDRLMALQMEREKKLEGIALAIKNMTAEADAIEAEIAVLTERKKVKENKAASLKEFLARVLDGETMETARVRISYRKSTAVNVSDHGALVEWLGLHHKECLRYTAPEPNKTEVTKLLKAGVEIPGTELETRQSLQIK